MLCLDEMYGFDGLQMKFTQLSGAVAHLLGRTGSVLPKLSVLQCASYITPQGFGEDKRGIIP